MIRHISFNNKEDLNEYIKSNVPQHIYYSSAYYQRPSAENMDEKGWLGADLIFDIDVDHIPTKCKELHDYWKCLNCGASGWGYTEKCPSCGSDKLEWEKWVCDICINYAREEIIKLIDILENDFGYSRSDMFVTFSGHRGFHLHLENEDVRDLDQDARREISDYVRGVGLETKLFLSRDGKNYRYRYNVVAPGWAGRIAKYLLLNNETDGGVDLEQLSKPFEWWHQNIKAAINELAVKIDEKVTIDIKRLIRLPGSLHGKTGLKVFTISPNEVENLDSETILKRAIVFSEERVKVRLSPLPRKILYYNFNSGENGIIEVPMYLAVYMMLNGNAEPVSKIG
jgi:DNA primase small subunit